MILQVPPRFFFNNCITKVHQSLAAERWSNFLLLSRSSAYVSPSSTTTRSCPTCSARTGKRACRSGTLGYLTQTAWTAGRGISKFGSAATTKSGYRVWRVTIRQDQRAAGGRFVRLGIDVVGALRHSCYSLPKGRCVIVGDCRQSARGTRLWSWQFLLLR